MNTNPVASFFSTIAEHYDSQFHDESDEDRQDDLDDVAEQVAELMRGHTVLELGCGTGYWTDVLAESAESVLATDISEEMLAVARGHGEGLENVQYRVVDALNLPTDLGKFTAVFAGFLWSHLKREDQDAFLAGLRARIGSNTLLVLIDDEYVEGVSPTVARTDAQGNTWANFTDVEGNRHELPKNYPTDSALRKRLGTAVREIKIGRWDSCWALTCRLK
ncbi:class I SAM-dependent methyltransferase [Massilia yuzhufengensis]|uniref:Methyltransferase domain-containing protein n=1 Tax=Massilia yuzhufengensis TaxID=1164594 RepID=A0A1I1K7V3_9BURK|nr:class I SAM-dependent methyltransferase [Massilia yuzhufengensis]SFC56635.1 Methyltransferase domain-containing protein [Massilia yuzhufengensis]